MSSVCIRDLLKWGVDSLYKAGIETAHLDAEVLMAHLIDVDRIHLYAYPKQVLDDETRIRYEELIRQRALRKPVAYITGHVEFMSLDFYVNNNVLIPRPETELIVELLNEFGDGFSKVLDVGTGSGVIAISLAKYNPGWKVLATDISMEAIDIAQENANRHGVCQRVRFVQMDLFNGLKRCKFFDWIVSNPPYIPTGQLNKLPPDVINYEPIIAIDGGPDGLNVIRKLIDEAHYYLNDEGRLVIEIGYGQVDAIKEILEDTEAYGQYRFIDDLSGIPRILYLEKRKVK